MYAIAGSRSRQLRPRSGRLQGCAPPKAGIKPQDSAPAESCLASKSRTCRRRQAARLAEALGERLCRETRLVALAAELLDRDVAGGVDLGARDDPRRAVLVPHPDVLHLGVEERVARLGHDLEVELVAEVRRVLREDAVAEQREDRRVLPLQLELELRLELVELVEMAHGWSLALPVSLGPGVERREELTDRPAPRDDELGLEVHKRLEREAPLVEAWMGQRQPRLVAVRARRGRGGRGRSSAGPSGPRRCDRDPGAARRRGAPRAASRGLELRLERDGAVQVRGLLDRPPRLRLPERRDADDARFPAAQRASRSRGGSSASRSPRFAPTPTYARTPPTLPAGPVSRNAPLTAVLTRSSTGAATIPYSPCHASLRTRSPRRGHGRSSSRPRSRSVRDRACDDRPPDSRRIVRRARRAHGRRRTPDRREAPPLASRPDAAGSLLPALERRGAVAATQLERTYDLAATTVDPRPAPGARSGGSRRSASTG